MHNIIILNNTTKPYPTTKFNQTYTRHIPFVADTCSESARRKKLNDQKNKSDL